MKKIILISLVLILSLALNAQTHRYIFCMQFDNIEQAQALEAQLSDSTTGYSAIAIVGHGYFTITPEQTTEDGEIIPAVIDTKYSASAMTKMEVPELMPYVISPLPDWWGHVFSGQLESWIVTK